MNEADRSLQWSKTRVEAISDGVFAIAITLLVIEIKINPGEFRHLEHALVHEWPGYLAYVTSFLTIGGVWLAHHGLFTRLASVEPKLLVINLVLLMAVAFLPFPTGVLAQALNSPAEAQHTAIVFYGTSVIVVELLLGGLGFYADPSRGVRGRQSESMRPQAELRRRVTVSTIAYALAIIIGLAVPDLAAVAFLVIAIALLSATVAEARLKPHRLEGSEGSSDTSTTIENHEGVQT